MEQEPIDFDELTDEQLVEMFVNKQKESILVLGKCLEHMLVTGHKVNLTDVDNTDFSGEYISYLKTAIKVRGEAIKLIESGDEEKMKLATLVVKSVSDSNMLMYIMLASKLAVVSQPEPKNLEDMKPLTEVTQ